MSDRKREETPPETTDVEASDAGDLLPPPVSDEVLDEVATKIRALQREATLELALGIGKIIIEDLYRGDVEAWRDRGAKDTSFRRLVAREDLGISRASLQRSVAIYHLCETLGVSTWRHLGVSHLRAVFGLDKKVQERLLAKADDKRWTVAHLEKEAKKARRKSGRRGGRTPLPSFQKSIARLARIAEKKEELFGGIEQLDELEPEQAETLYQQVLTVKLACEALQEKLQPRTPGFARQNMAEESVE